MESYRQFENEQTKSAYNLIWSLIKSEESKIYKYVGYSSLIGLI